MSHPTSFAGSLQHSKPNLASISSFSIARCNLFSVESSRLHITTIYIRSWMPHSLIQCTLTAVHLWKVCILLTTYPYWLDKRQWDNAGVQSTLYSIQWWWKRITVSLNYDIVRWNLVKNKCHCDTCLYFFSQWVTNRWNSVSQEAIDAPSLHVFKNHLERRRSRRWTSVKTSSLQVLSAAQSETLSSTKLMWTSNSLLVPHAATPSKLIIMAEANYNGYYM